MCVKFGVCVSVMFTVHITLLHCRTESVDLLASYLLQIIHFMNIYILLPFCIFQCTLLETVYFACAHALND